MTFWYNGYKIRTSKTHHYTHAIINSKGGCVMCSATKQGCEREKQRFINECIEGIENCKRAINAIENGRSRYELKDGRRSYYQKPTHTIEEYKSLIQTREQSIEYYRNNWTIVEIEERA